MEINNWELILNNSSLKIKNDFSNKEYLLAVFMKGKEIVGVGEVSPTISYDKKYPVLELVEGENTFDILANFFKGCFKDFTKIHVKGLLTKFIKPHVTFCYNRDFHERFIGFEQTYLREALKIAGAREVRFQIV